MRGALAAVAVGTLLAGTMSAAHAETGAAEALFRAGREAAKRGDHVTACVKFSESNRLEPTLGTQLNLALCEEELGNLLKAWHLLHVVTNKLPASDDRLQIARRHLE